MRTCSLNMAEAVKEGGGGKGARRERIDDNRMRRKGWKGDGSHGLILRNMARWRSIWLKEGKAAESINLWRVCRYHCGWFPLPILLQGDNDFVHLEKDAGTLEKFRSRHANNDGYERSGPRDGSLIFKSYLSEIAMQHLIAISYKLLTGFSSHLGLWRFNHIRSLALHRRNRIV